MIIKSRAEEIALAALNWLAGDDELVSHFMGMTGSDMDGIRQGASHPEFLGFVLDFILSADEMVLACAEAINEAPDHIAMARAMLPGGDIPNWT